MLPLVRSLASSHVAIRDETFQSVANGQAILEQPFNKRTFALKSNPARTGKAMKKERRSNKVSDNHLGVSLGNEIVEIEPDWEQVMLDEQALNRTLRRDKRRGNGRLAYLLSFSFVGSLILMVNS